MRNKQFKHKQTKYHEGVVHIHNDLLVIEGVLRRF